MYFFTDNSGFEADASISYTLGFEWFGDVQRNNSTRLLFVHRKKVAAFVDFDEDDITVWMFTRAIGHGLGRSDARFAVYRSCEQGYQSIEMVQLALLNSPGFQKSIQGGCQDWPAQVARRKFIADSIDRVEATQATSAAN